MLQHAQSGARAEHLVSGDPLIDHGDPARLLPAGAVDQTPSPSAYAALRFMTKYKLPLEALQAQGVHAGAVMTAGDLVEESSPPFFNDDSWPMDWPLSLDMVLGLTTAASVVVPGHGSPVDRDFVEDQRNTIGIVAETIRDLATRGVPLDQALEVGDWPWPKEHLATAVRRGYEQLPRSQKRLPLV